MENLNFRIATFILIVLLMVYVAGCHGTLSGYHDNPTNIKVVSNIARGRYYEDRMGY